ncbi:MAG TPA: hypothetical protein VNN19_08480 [bacterium]|nr:hypothetical protein [bacterium]
MRPGVLVALLLTFGLLPPAAAQPAVRTVVVAEFENASVDSIAWHAGQFSALLGQLLQQQGGAPLRVVGAAAAAQAMRALGYTPADLVSPARAAEVARLVGADWIITGRWSQLRLVALPDPVDRLEPIPPARDVLAVADVTVRVLDAGTRRTLFEGRFGGQAAGDGYGSLYIAAYQALAAAARSVVRL